jgi:hypothetical protein
MEKNIWGKILNKRPSTISSEGFEIILVENIGFEPTTSSLPAKRSSQMS